MLLKDLHSFSRSAVEWSRQKAGIFNSQTVSQRGSIFPRIGLSLVWNKEGEKFLDYWWNLIKIPVESSAPPLEVIFLSQRSIPNKNIVSISPAVSENNTANRFLFFRSLY
jgi:hypothetical protein